MELKIKNGDYVLGADGTLEQVDGSAELLQRVLYKLTARREGFPFLQELGSELYRLGRTAPRERAGAAELAVRQTLGDEADLEVTDVTLTEKGGGLYDLHVALSWSGHALEVALTVQ